MAKAILLFQQRKNSLNRDDRINNKEGNKINTYLNNYCKYPNPYNKKKCRFVILNL
jgi:hypothetical protein